MQRERDLEPGAGSASKPTAQLPDRIEVAVPVPVPGALTYAIPEGPWRAVLAPGCRVRVPVGKRALVGVVVRTFSSLDAKAQDPEDGEDTQQFRLRGLLEVVDLEPLLSEELLDLAQFVADYYLAPLGEVVRAFYPQKLEGWGRRRVHLTEKGMFQARPTGDGAALVDLLVARGSQRQADLQEALPDLDVAGVVAELNARGWVRLESSKGRRGALRSAYEIGRRDPDEVRAELGRSPKALAAWEWLLATGRPATKDEICNAASCSVGVLQRLEKLGAVRSFSELRPPQGVERHLTPSLPSEERLELLPEQAAAVDALHGALRQGGFQPFLLHGLTGSGKTEVFLRAIEFNRQAQRSTLVLVPEIAMVPTLARTLLERFGRAVAVLHSGLSASERVEEWLRIRSGEADIVVGPRSAVFAPTRDVGLIVVDEEHDSAYKQETTPRYNGRDLALVRARGVGATVVLASATPALESRHNVDIGRYQLLELTQRVGTAELPTGEVVDLRREEFRHRPGEICFSTLLRQRVEETLGRGEQVILLRNRRGFAPLLLCRACGEDLRCDDCGLPRTWHRKQNVLACHYCGSRRAVPSRCVSCGEQALEPIGAGTERVEDEFRQLYPNVTVDTLDRDVVQRVGGAAAVLERFRNGATQVLVGTQMVAKGHHFPNVSLVAVLSADSYLGFPDFRAVERTYNLLTQVAGRAGRGERPGRFILQTHHPDHYAIRAALNHDDTAFAAEELRFRRIFGYPPFCRMASLLVQHTSRQHAERIVRELAQRIHDHPLASQLRTAGPAPAAFERLRGRWRFQFLVRAPSHKVLRRVLSESQATEDRHTVVDVDPHDLL